VFTNAAGTQASASRSTSSADDNNPHAAEALEGARKLSHRTSDAVAWLTQPHSNVDGAFLMRYLLQLDLEATPELCRAGLAWVEDEFAKAYRPKPDNPLPYSRPLIAVLGPRRMCANSRRTRKRGRLSPRSRSR